MTINLIKENLTEAGVILDAFIKDPNNLKNVESAGKIMLETIRSGHKVISCGNGGSMSDAMHFAEELTGKFRENRKAIAAISISDPTHISCTANDYGYHQVFSRYIEATGDAGDTLLAISTSGNSENVLNAAITAQKAGIKVIALTGKDGGKLKEYCDIEIRVPHFGYADRIQEMHIKIIHSLIHFIESGL